MYNIDTQEHVAVHMCGFDWIQRSINFGREPIGRSEFEVRVGKDEITGEMIKGGGLNLEAL